MSTSTSTKTSTDSVTTGAGKSTPAERRHVVVIGAGYAGMNAALRAGKANRVTLIAPEDRFLNRVRQHEVAAGHSEHRPSFERLSRGRDVTRIQARVTELDLAGHKVFTDIGTAIKYDTLVYALGSRTAFCGVPGAADHAFPMERAVELRDRIAGAAQPGTVAVVGGGATGIELAAELAEAHPAWQIRIVTAGQVGGWLSARGRAVIARRFERLNITIQEQTQVTAVEPGGLQTSVGPVAADLVAWTASFEVPELAAEAGLAVDGAGRAVVDSQLRSVSHQDVYVVGDAAIATVEGVGRLRMACATAGPMGTYVGKALNAQTRGQDTGSFSYKYVIQCLSLGRKSGLVQLIRPDDSMRERAITGPMAKLTKAGICWLITATLR